MSEKDHSDSRGNLINNKKILLFIGVAVLFVFLSRDLIFIKINSALDEWDKAVFVDKYNNFKESDPSYTEDDVIDVIPDKYKNRYSLALKGNVHKIDFWGQVVDQKQQPVSGVKIKYGLGGSFISGGKHGYVETDAEGYFRIENEGSSLYISEIERSLIEHKFLDRNASFFFSPGRGKSVGNHSRKKNRFLIEVWRFENLPKLKYDEGWFSVDGDSSEYILGLNQDNMMRMSKVPYNEGHFKLVFNMNNSSEETARDWEFYLEPINDVTILRYNDPYMNIAPDTGYEKSRIVFSGAAGDSKYLFDNRIFFRHANGYGALVFDFTIKYTHREFGTADFKYKYKFNAESTNLQKPNW